MRWRIEWLIETLLIPIWLASEWVSERREWFHRWQTAEREAALYLGMSFPGEWT
jgi:hypothetical protein